MLSVIYAECDKTFLYGECNRADCRYAECLYAECRGAENTTMHFQFLLSYRGKDI
jgi:hypothetical protein